MYGVSDYIIPDWKANLQFTSINLGFSFENGQNIANAPFIRIFFSGKLMSVCGF